MQLHKLLIAPLLLAIVSCSHMTKVQLTTDTDGQAIEHTKTINYYLFGLFPRTAELNASELCKEGTQLTEVQYYSSPLDRLLTIYTAAIYSRKTLAYRCAL